MFKGHQDGIRVVGNGETLAPPLSVYNNGTAKVFQSRYARNGRGAPSDVVPALAAQSGGTGPGGPEPLLFQPRYFTRGAGGPPSDVVPALAANARQSDTTSRVLIGGDIAHTLRASYDASEDGTGRGTPLVAGTVSSKWAKGTGGPAGDEAYNLTLQAGVRRLTPTECERLQGFPDGWTAGQADAHRYRQMGNAVCVPVVEWIGRRAVAWLEGRRLEALDG